MAESYGHISMGEVRPEVALAHCPDHPDQTEENCHGGFGLAGGGFGPYNICNTCGRIFNKVDIGDGE